MTRLPQSADPRQSYTAVYDAWNRLVRVSDTLRASLVAEYGYDGVNRRIVKWTYTDGVLSEMRRFYYSTPAMWQVLEERVGVTSLLERQLVWGPRYVDDLLLRDRDSDSTGSMNERLHAMQDGNWNVMGVVNFTCSVVERYAYSPYGQADFFNAHWCHARQSSLVLNTTLYTGRELCADIGVLCYRARDYDGRLGVFLRRDPVTNHSDRNLYRYVRNQPILCVDAFGETAYPPYPDYDYGEGDFTQFGPPKSSSCAGTFCYAQVGVKTVVNSKGDKTCDHPCKKFLWQVHEGEHRKNLGGCCNAYRACLAIATQVGQTSGADEQHKFETLCREGWRNWLHVNELALEQRAAAATVTAGRNAIKLVGAGGIAVPVPPDCCDVISKEIQVHAPHADANAQIEGCPFDAFGEINVQQFHRLRQLAGGT
jgi:RHS repeat-associated protein